MREILFKGKRLDNGKWIEGYLSTSVVVGDDFMLFTIDDSPVDPETVCQYTGAKDRTGRKIFEKDVISVEYEEDWWERPRVWYENYEVYFSDEYYAYRARQVHSEDYWLREFDIFCTVIGNTIDNPKLMEE